MNSSTLNPPQSLNISAKRPRALSSERIIAPLMSLLSYVQARDYEGHDLFDGLNSRLFQMSPLWDNRYARLALIQFCKQSPINFRPLLRVPAGFNPKGGALFLMGHLNLWKATGEPFHAREAHCLFERLKSCAIRRESGYAWGYNFDWQARAFNVPMGTPNLVTSVYVGRALLAFADAFDNDEARRMAVSISRWLLDEMVKFENDRFLCFNYIPGRDAEVHNANLLGAAYLARTHQYLDNIDGLPDKIFKSIRFSVEDIQQDGSWPYGTKPFHRWVDNFHTGFNIEALLDVAESVQTDELSAIIEGVTGYYLKHLFTEDGTPKYYAHKLYPVDVHVLAEFIVLANRLRRTNLSIDWNRIDQIETRLSELIGKFQSRRGYFYHQKLAWGWNKTPYIRWGQAWMFYALSTCLEEI